MCILTEHSKDRMKERCGSNKSSQERMANLALENGIKHSQTAGNLKRYLDGLYLQQETANNMRIWGDKVYLFHNTLLITILQLPQKYMKTCNQIRAKEQNTT